LGVISYRLEKLEDGRWRFACAVRGQTADTQREVEAVASCEADAVSAVFGHLTGSGAAR
jgi:hypothetical protein